jgi:hypothetical protein
MKPSDILEKYMNDDANTDGMKALYLLLEYLAGQDKSDKTLLKKGHDYPYGSYHKEQPAEAKEPNALEKAREKIENLSNHFYSTSVNIELNEIKGYYETALQQERERAEWMEKTIFSMNNDFTVLRKKFDAHKALLQELEEWSDSNYESIPIRYFKSKIQDLKKKHGVSE